MREPPAVDCEVRMFMKGWYKMRVNRLGWKWQREEKKDRIEMKKDGPEGTDGGYEITEGSGKIGEGRNKHGFTT